jgi:hypoxanthine-DNA glycosylase
MGQLFGFSPALPYKERLKRLQENKIALWDTVHSCVREGSLDSDIKHAEVNDLENFFKQHKALKAIFFNGQTAYKLFRQHMKNAVIPELELHIMPSTSPAHAARTYEQKFETWKKVTEYTKNPA